MAANDTPDTRCRAALESLRELALGAWRGWPAACTAEQVTAVLGEPRPGVGRGFLGTAVREMSFRLYTLPGATAPLRVWSEDGHPLMADLELPAPAGGPEALLSALGEPSARLDFSWDRLLLPRAEWVYPDRGLALMVNPANGKLLRLVVLPAVSLEAYQAEWRLVLGSHRRPLDP